MHTNRKHVIDRGVVARLLSMGVHCKGATTVVAVTAAAALAFSVTACGSSGNPDEVKVLAAASLSEPFTQLADELSSDTELAFSFGASSALVEQLRAGARADVLATADTRTMDRAVEAGVISGEPRAFAGNELVLAVPAGNPAEVQGLADLARPELRVALCEPQVPCGAAAEEMLASAGVDARPDTLEADVTDTAGKLALGEVDAALIYRTDVTGEMEIVDVPPNAKVVTEYMIAVVDGAPNPAGAEDFVAAVTGDTGQRLLAEAGFGTP